MIITDLENADLHVDAVYGGSRLGHGGDDPLPGLLGVDNGAGFRVLGKRKKLETLKLIVLVTSFKSVDWPDALDRETGVFTYYGDRHEPGDIHDTPRDGNLILKNIFDAYHTGRRDLVPPILVFGKTGSYRDMQFLGLAVPGAEGLSSDEDLVAVWRIKDGVRFQNYRATFSILDEGCISQNWINDIRETGRALSAQAPKNWVEWINGGAVRPLMAQPVKRLRSKKEQTPKEKDDREIINLILDFYKHKPTAFERCALDIARFSIGNVARSEVTRPWRDGGRDAVGEFRIGEGMGAIYVEFALEAKLYGISNGVGVKELSRLISRLRHRQFGVLVTTSFVSLQAYEEVLTDGHPIVIISAVDIARTLRERLGGLAEIRKWLVELEKH